MTDAILYGRDGLTARFPPHDRTLPVMLARQAEAFGECPLLVFHDETWSYAHAAKVAAAMAKCLAAAGIAPGDRVALLVGNRSEFMRCFLGCAWLGAIAVPINTASRGAQLGHIFATCNAKLLVVEVGLLEALKTIGDVEIGLRTIWVVDDAAQQPSGLEFDAGARAAEWKIEPLPEPGPEMEPHEVAPGDTVAILFTSGTTGLSKGVCCPHAQYFWWGHHTAQLLRIREGDVLLTPLPLFHTNALNSFYQALLTGSTLVVESRFSVSRFFSSLAGHRATATYLLGAMVPMLLSRPPCDEDRNHRTRIALAPAAPPHQRAEFTRRFGIGLIDGYGSTETNFVIGATLEESRPGLMGKVRPGFSARVVDGHDNPLPAGVAGELLLRADEPYAFSSGYFGMAEKTVEAWRNLWFHTGDRVVADESGYFRFIDRMKDVIRRRGENISSFEVEQVLISHPAVANAAVYPVRSELAEDEVMAAVVLRPSAALTPEQLLDFCQPRMPYFAVPRYIDFVSDLPMTKNGKVTKFALQERGVTAASWDREKAGYEVSRPATSSAQAMPGRSRPDTSAAASGPQVPGA